MITENIKVSKFVKMGNKVRNINRGDSVNSIWEVANTGNQKVWL